MSVDTAGTDEQAVLIEIAAEIFRFVQQFPNHYASRALAGIVNRDAAGERVEDDERELVLLTLVHEAKAQAGRKPFRSRR